MTTKRKRATKKVKESVLGNPVTTLLGLAQGAALAYLGYKMGNPELILAGVAASGVGAVAKDN